MKRHLIWDILLALFPTAALFGYGAARLRIDAAAAASFALLPKMLCRILGPFGIGVLAALAVCYALKNRKTTVFVWLFCGALLLQLAVIACILGRPLPVGLANRGLMGLELGELLAGAYFLLFWVSLIGWLRGRRQDTP